MHNVNFESQGCFFEIFIVQIGRRYSKIVLSKEQKVT